MNAATKTTPLKSALQSALHRALYPRAGLPASLTAGVLGVLAAPAALADPTGGTVVAGDAGISQQGNGTIINQTSQRAIIDWETFSIGIDEYVLFNQPGSSAVILNRVIGGNPSVILGNLTANGQVFLVNPNGVFFGDSAMLDVGGLLATTLDISNADFMAGNYHFVNTDNSHGDVVNAGHITASDGGYVVLAGDKVENTGVIAARAGHVVLAAGRAITLDVAGDGLVNFAVNEATLSDLAGVRNAGQILADGGLVLMTAKVASELVTTAVNNEGLVQAHGISETQDGAIFLTAEGGDIVNAGTIDADGINSQSGGLVYLHGNEDIDLESGSVITAAGSGSGSGGTVRVIAENTLSVSRGSKVYAQGGIDGAGGFIEISGHGGLLLAGDVRVGSGGLMLIDPSALTISQGTGSSSPISGTVTDGWIEGRLNAGSDVLLVASNSISANSSVSAINATNVNGDLQIAIGSIAASVSTSGCFVNGACTLPLDTGSTLNLLTGGTINLSGVTINIAGNFDASASQGSVQLGDITASTISIVNANSITTGNLTATGATSGAAALGIDLGVSGFGAITVNGAITATAGAVSINNTNGVITITGNSTGAAISANGDIDVIAGGEDVTIGAGSFFASNFTGRDVVSNNGNIDIQAQGGIFTGALSAINGSINLTATGGFGSTANTYATILIGENSGTDTGFDITAGADVQINATAGGFNGTGANATITAGNITGEFIYVDAIGGAGSIGPSGDSTVDIGSVDGYSIHIGANNITTDNLNATGFETSGIGVDIDGTDPNASININGYITALAAGAGVSLTANSGDITVAGSAGGIAISAAGDITINANNGDVTLGTGTYSATNFTGRKVTSQAGNITIQAENIYTGSLSAAANINLAASPSAGGNAIIVVGQNAGGVSASDVTGFGVTAGGSIDIKATANTGFGSNTRIVVGDVLGTNVNMRAITHDSYGGDAIIDAGNITATTGALTLLASNSGGVASAGGGVLPATASIDAGNLDAGTTLSVSAVANPSQASGGHITAGTVAAERITIEHTGNQAAITLGAITAINTAGQAMVTVITGSDPGVTQAGDITVNGNITASGLAVNETCGFSSCDKLVSGQITGASVTLDAGANGNSIGSAGNVTVNGAVNITANTANVSFSQLFDGFSVVTTGTQGAAELNVRGAITDIGGSLIMQGADAAAVIAAGQVTIGAVQITATGHNTTLVSGPSGAGTGSSLTSVNNAGHAILNIEGIGSSANGAQNAASSVNLGVVTIKGKGHAALHVAAQNTTIASASVSAAAATYTRTITGSYAGPDSFGYSPFTNGSPKSRLTQGSVTIGNASIQVNGGSTCTISPSFTCSPNVATSLTVNTNLAVKGVGDAMIYALANTIDIGGNITAIATAGNVASGTGTHSYTGTGASTNGTYTVTTTSASGSFGEASVELNNGSGTGPIQVAGTVNVQGPAAGFTAEGNGTITLGAITITGNGENYHEKNVYTLQGNPPPSGSTLTSFTTSFTGLRDQTSAVMDIHGGNVTLNGDLTISGVGVAGAIIEGTSVAVKNINVTANSTSMTTLDTRVSPATNSTQRGDAIFGITEMSSLGSPIAGATVTGNVTVTGAIDAHVGINADISGNLVVKATTGDIDTAMPSFLSSAPAMPPLAVSADAVLFSAGGDILLSGSTINAGSGSTSFAGDNETANAAGLPAGSTPNAAFIAGGTLTLGTLSLTGNYLWLEANTFGTVSSVSLPSTALVQFTTHDATRSLGIDGSTSGTAQTTLGQAYVDVFGTAGTLAFGDSTHTGGLLLAETTPVNLATENLIFATDGNITGTNSVSAAQVTFVTDTLSNITASLNTGLVEIIAGNNVDLTLSGPAAFTFGADTFGSVSLITTGDLTLSSGLSAADILLQANTGAISLGANTLTATNAITLDADTTFTGTDLLTANTLNLIGAATTDFNVLTNVNAFDVQSGNDITIDNTANAGAATVMFGAGPFGIVDVTSGGTLDLLSALSAADITLRGFTGLDLGANTLTATNNILLDTGGTFTSTGLITANSLTLAGGTTTDFNVLTDVNAFDIQSGNDITIANTGAATVMFGAGPFGIVDVTSGGTLSLLSALSAADITLRGILGLDLGANTLTATSNILLDTGGTFTSTGLITANSLTLAGGTTTDFNVLTDVNTLTVNSGRDIVVNNTGTLSASFATGTYGTVSLITTGDLTLSSGLSAADILLQANTGAISLGANTLTATNAITLDTDTTFTGTGLLTANTLNLIGGATTDFNVLTDVNTLTVNSGRDIVVDNTGTLSASFATGTYGTVSLITTGDLTLSSGLSAADILLQANTGAISLGANTLTATNAITLDADTTFTGTDLLTANTLNLIGAATTDFNVLTNVNAFDVQSGNDITIDNTANAGAATVMFGAGPFGIVDVTSGGTLDLLSALSAADITLRGFTGLGLGANTLTAANNILLDTGGTFTSTGLITANSLTLAGGATTDFNVLTDVNAFDVQSGNDITIDNTANAGAATAMFGAGPFGIVDVTSGGTLDLLSALSAADITLRGITGLGLGANTLTATNNILLDTGGTFTGTGLITANSLTLAGGATTDFNVLTNVNAFDIQSGNDVSIDNTAFTGTAALAFGAGPFGLVDAIFGGGVDLTSAFTGTGFALTTPGNLNTGNNTITATGTVSFDVDGSATANGLITANSFVLIGETNTAYNFTTSAADIQLLSAGDITINNTAHTGSAYVYFGPDTFNNIALTMGGNTGIGAASSLTANNAAIVVNNGSLDISNHTFSIAGSLAMVADGSVQMSGVNITAGTLTINAGGNITDSGTIGSGTISPLTSTVSGAVAPASITADAAVLAAGGDILLGQTTFTIGNGTFSDFTGDQALLDILLSEGLITDTNGPNAVFSANGTVEIGDTSVAGGYLFVTATAVNFTGNITGPNDLLVQLVPFGGTGPVSLENTVSTGSGLNLDAQDMGAIQANATIALGFSGYAGNVTLGQNGTVDLGSQNFIVATSGNIDSIDNITSTGQVSSLEELVSGGDFSTPTTDELSTSDGSGTSDEEDEDEENKDTSGDGTGNTGEEDTLIKHDTTEENGVCKV